MSSYPMYEGKDTCERCHEALEKSKSVWLTYNQRKGIYTLDDVPENHSQGAFAFGERCAKATLKNGGHIEYIGKALKNNL